MKQAKSRVSGTVLDEPIRPMSRVPAGMRAVMPNRLKQLAWGLYWMWYDARDFVAELTGWIPSHRVRLLLYRRVLGAQIGSQSSVHMRCRMYRPLGVHIGNNSVINREVLLDGRMGLTIGNCVSVSEGSAIFTLEHDPQSPTFANRGGAVTLGDHVFVGARAIILPGVAIHEGAVIAAGAVVTKDVGPFTIAGGVPARPIGTRRRDLTYKLDYRKFLG